MPKLRAGTWAGLVFLAIGGVMIAWHAYRFATWSVADGRITSVRGYVIPGRTQGHESNQVRLKIAVEYEVKGQKYIGGDDFIDFPLNAYRSLYREGEPIRVLYDPASPYAMDLDGEWSFRSWGFSLTWCLVGLFFIGVTRWDTNASS